MTFQWTFGTVLVIAAAVVVASWIGWGFWAAFSHVHAIIATAAAALFVIWARTGLKPWSTVQRQDEPFTGYPMDQVLGIFDTTHEAGEAIEDFRREGFTDEQMAIYSDRQGAARLDTEGTAHGLTQVAQRQLEHLMADVDHLEGYEHAVRQGAVVVGVMAPDEEPRARAAEIFQRHRGREVHYFGSMMVRRLDVDGSPTQAS